MYLQVGIASFRFQAFPISIPIPIPIPIQIVCARSRSLAACICICSRIRIRICICGHSGICVCAIWVLVCVYAPLSLSSSRTHRTMAPAGPLAPRLFYLLRRQPIGWSFHCQVSYLKITTVYTTPQSHTARGGRRVLWEISLLVLWPQHLQWPGAPARLHKFVLRSFNWVS